LTEILQDLMDVEYEKSHQVIGQEVIKEETQRRFLQDLMNKRPGTLMSSLFTLRSFLL